MSAWSTWRWLGSVGAFQGAVDVQGAEVVEPPLIRAGARRVRHRASSGGRHLRLASWQPGDGTGGGWGCPASCGPRCRPARNVRRPGGPCVSRSSGASSGGGGRPRTGPTRSTRSRRPTRAGSNRWGRCAAGRCGPGPVHLVEEAHEGRLQRLVPVRVGRMMASPYAFLRGSAALMAEDFAHLPRTGIEPVICGDAHLGNFGFYASPERDLVFDLNDFDEAHPGPWEWDLYRLTTSVWVAGRQNGLSEDTCEDAVLRCAYSYRRQLRALAGQPLLPRSFDRLHIDRMRAELADWSLRGEIERAARQARTRTSDRALPKLTRERGGARPIVDPPPPIADGAERETNRLIEGLEGYLDTLPPHWRRVLGYYVVVDLAHKVVGVGSV